METAIKVQTVYQQKVAIGEVGRDEISEPAVLATHQMYKAWAFWRHRFKFYDQTLVKRRFKDIKHSPFVIEGRPPVIAASSLVAVKEADNAKDVRWAALNVMPLTEDRTGVVLSYPGAHSGDARKHFARVMLKQGEERLVALSTLIVDQCENFFLRPSHVEAWGDEKRAHLEAAFMSTVTKNAYLQPSPDLMLF